MPSPYFWQLVLQSISLDFVKSQHVQKVCFLIALSFQNMSGLTEIRNTPDCPILTPLGPGKLGGKPFLEYLRLSL